MTSVRQQQQQQQRCRDGVDDGEICWWQEWMMTDSGGNGFVGLTS